MKVFVFLVAIASVLVACTKGAQDKLKDPIVIGEFGSLTGRESSFGKNTHEGIQMAVDEVNSNGGINLHPIKLITKNNQSRLEKTTTVVKELVEKDNVMALLGEVASNRTLVAAPIAQRHKTPLLSPSSTNPRVTEVGNFIFRACYVDPFQGQVMANFAYKDLKVKKVAVFKDKKSNYSMGLANFFVKTFRHLGGTIVANENYNSGDIDFKEQLKFIRTEQPEAIFIPGYYTEAALIARQIKKLGIHARLLGGDGWDSPKLFEIGRESVNGAYFSNHFTSESKNPLSQKFIKSFRTRYGHVPDGVAAMGYDAAKMLFAAIKKAKPLTRDNIRKELALTHNFPGVTGPITIDKSRNAIKESVIVKVDGPTNHFVTTIEPQN